MPRGSYDSRERKSGEDEMSRASRLWQDDIIERDGIRIETAFQPAVSLALVHNHVPLVRSVTVTNTSDKAIQDLSLSLSLDGRGATLAEPWIAQPVDELAPGKQRQWEDFGLFAPKYQHLAQLNESHPATLTAQVSRSWGPDVVLTVGVQMLAHNEWFNAPSFYESLAAFVQPNTHAVAAVLGDAAELLREHTGSASLSGYQEGPERASRMAAAVYEALRRRGIRYAGPPASFEQAGQKVRTTAQVLDQRLGTCVDLVVTYAACLEQAGLHPLLWLVEGHALAGYLRDGGTLGQTVVTEPNMMINLAESGQMVPVEAAFYETGPDGTFAMAVAQGKRHLAVPDALFGLIDVHAARRAGTRPLLAEDDRPVEPAAQRHEHAVEDDGGLTLPADLLARPDEDDVLLEVEDDAPPRVRQWKRALLDLSTRNRLLNLRPSAEVLDLYVPGDSLAQLDDIVHEGKLISLIAQDDLSELHRLQGAKRAQDLDPEVARRQLVEDHAVFVGVTEQVYLTRMRRLQRTARTMLEETGNANLHLAVGALVHRTPAGKEARAPLFLLPVKIEGGSGRSAFQFRIDTTGVASPNHSLVEWLRIKHDVRIEALETPKLDRSGIDIVAALPEIRAALVQHRLDARIDEIAALAICDFSTFGMWRDLEHSWDVLSQSPVARHLALNPGETFLDPSARDGQHDIHPDEAETPLPIPADGSQLRAVTLAAAGRSFVLEGPPGTGKSQTITNLIAHTLACGKTVLFVAEKQAALDVVKRRLTKIGLADFTLDLHGRSQRPSEIRAQLKRAIDNTSVYDSRGWEAVRATLRARHAPLVEYPRKVHTRNDVGVSMWSAYENLRQYGEGASAPIPAHFVADGAAHEQAVKDAVRTFQRAAGTVDLRPEHPWALTGDLPDTLSAADLVAAAEELERLRSTVAASPLARALLSQLGDPSDIPPVLVELEDQVGGVAPDAAQLAMVTSPSWASSRQELVAAVEGFHAQQAAVLGVLSRAFIEHGDATGLTAAAEAAQGGIFGRRRRLDAFEQTLRSVLAEDAASVVPSAVPGLVMAMSAARAHATKLKELARDVFGGAVPSTWSPLAEDAIVPLKEAATRLERAQRFRQEHPDLWPLLGDHQGAGIDDVELLRAVERAWAQWCALLATGEDEQRRWRAGRHWLDAWDQDGPTWRRETADGADASAQRWAQMVRILEPLRVAGLDEFRDALIGMRIPAADAEVAFLRGVAEASLRERRDAGGLRAFDAAVHDGEIADYATAAAAAQEEQVVALPAELLDRRPYRGDQLTGAGRRAAATTGRKARRAGLPSADGALRRADLAG